MLLFIFFQVGVSRRPAPPQLAANCTKATFALSTESVRLTRPVTYTIAGPEGHLFVIGIDVLSYARQPDGGWLPVPQPGKEDLVRTAAAKGRMKKECRYSGYFAIPAGLGEHTVTLFELTDHGAVELERRTVTTTQP